MRGKAGLQSLADNLVQNNHNIVVETSGPGFRDVTNLVSGWLDIINVQDGLLTIFICHTSASLTIQENADPDVLSDLEDTLNSLAPESSSYRHSSEGPDDMPAHIKSMLTSTSLNIPVQDRRMVLGAWQGIYLIEHRMTPHRRRLALHYLGTVKS